jgi:hypothetical protein
MFTKVCGFYLGIYHKVRQRSVYFACRLVLSGMGTFFVQPRWAKDSARVAKMARYVVLDMTSDKDFLETMAKHSGHTSMAVSSTLRRHIDQRKCCSYVFGPAGWSMSTAEAHRSQRPELGFLGLRRDFSDFLSLPRSIFCLRHELQHEVQELYLFPFGLLNDGDNSAIELDADEAAWNYLRIHGKCSLWGHLRWRLYRNCRQRTSVYSSVFWVAVIALFATILVIVGYWTRSPATCNVIGAICASVAAGAFLWLASEEGV